MWDGRSLWSFEESLKYWKGEKTSTQAILLWLITILDKLWRSVGHFSNSYCGITIFPSSSDSVIKMFHCLFIVFKISLFSMPSSHDSVIGMFHCLFIVLKSHCSPCHPVMIQWSECSIVFSLF
jgi:hypothetical protein